jgi:hypothetical protein
MCNGYKVLSILKVVFSFGVIAVCSHFIISYSVFKEIFICFCTFEEKDGCRQAVSAASALMSSALG